jgi:DNA-binding transcriptional ArsR family regulator
MAEGGHADGQVSWMRAIAHPVRLRILSLLTGAEMSAPQVARELGISHANASYHVRFLADAGLLVVAGEERIRGGVAKRYRHPWEQEGGGGPTSDDDRAQYMRVVAEEMVRRWELRRDGVRGSLTDAELWVGEEVWTEVRDLLERASHLLHAAARPPRSPGTVPVSVSVAAFQVDAGRIDAGRDDGEGDA